MKLKHRLTDSQRQKRKEKIRRREVERTGRETRRHISARMNREWVSDVGSSVRSLRNRATDRLGEAIASILGNKRGG